MNTITQQIHELQDMAVAELVVRYEDLHGKPPRVRNKAFLQRRVAWALQAREFGALSARATKRLDELIAQIDLPLGDPGPRRAPSVHRREPKAPLVGTTLIRQWRDQEIRVEVRTNGFEWDDTLYRSLSAVAKAITGTTWNGRLFFGLVQRRRAE